MSAVPGEREAEFKKLLNRYRNLLHGAVIEDCKGYPSDRRLREMWAAAEAAEDQLREFVLAALPTEGEHG